MSRKLSIREAEKKRLGLIGWIRARLLERKMRKAWNGDPRFRMRVRKYVERELSKTEFKATGRPQFTANPNRKETGNVQES